MDSNSVSGDIETRLVKALGHPLRVEILELLSAGDAISPKELSDIMDQSLGVCSYHVTKVLYEDCEVLELASTAQRRGAVEHYYKLKPNAFLGSPIMQRSVPAILRKHIAGAALKAFTDEAVRSLKDGKADLGDPSLISWMSIAVDQDGQKKIKALLDETWSKVAEIEEECAPKLKDDPGKKVPVIVGLSSFEAVPRKSSVDGAD